MRVLPKSISNSYPKNRQFFPKWKEFPRKAASFGQGTHSRLTYNIEVIFKKLQLRNKSLFSRVIVISLLGSFTLSCGQDYDEDMAVSDAHSYLTKKECQLAIESLKRVHASPDDYGYDGKIAWGGAEACLAGFFLVEFIADVADMAATEASTLAAFAALETSDHTVTQRIGSSMFNASGEAYHSQTEHLMESIRIFQSTSDGDSTEWTTEVSTNLLFLSMASIGRFLNFHGYDGAGADFSQDFDLDDNIGAEANCTDSYTNQTATLPDDTLGIGNGPDNIDRPDACMLGAAFVTLNVSFANVGSSYDELVGLGLSTICDLGGVDLCDSEFAKYESCLDGSTAMTDHDLYGIMCVADSAW